MGAFLPAVALVLLLTVVLYWLLIATEGVYLGPRVVTWLYDRAASQYEAIKKFDPECERALIGAPLARMLPPGATILDVGAGTLRVARALRAAGAAQQVIAVDRSRRMLEEGRKLLPGAGACHLVQADCMALPLASGSCDAVTFLEVAEFVQNLGAALAECQRVLSPGGVLLLSNRKGWARWYMPGHVRSAEELTRMLEREGFCEIVFVPWQVEYDLVLARKPVRTQRAQDVPDQGQALPAPAR